MAILSKDKEMIELVIEYGFDFCGLNPSGMPYVAPVLVSRSVVALEYLVKRLPVVRYQLDPL